MGYILCVAYVIVNLLEGLVVKNHTRKYGNGGTVVNALTCLFSMIFFIVTEALETDAFYFPPRLWIYGGISIIMFSAGFYFTYVAYKIGPFGLTKLLSTFSLLFPIVYGLVFLNEEGGALSYLGIALMLSAAVLINLKREESGEKQKITFKWLVCIIISAVANGMISVLSRMQQISFDNATSNEFMMISLFGSFIVLSIWGVLKEKRGIGLVIRNGALTGALAGVLNGAKNFITLLVYLYLPLSIVSPLKTSLSMIATFAVSYLLYKERYGRLQLVGVVLGAASVVLLSL